MADVNSDLFGKLAHQVIGACIGAGGSPAPGLVFGTGGGGGGLRGVTVDTDLDDMMT